MNKQLNILWIHANFLPNE